MRRIGLLRYIHPDIHKSFQYLIYNTKFIDSQVSVKFKIIVYLQNGLNIH